jgi:hypothetical protein
MSTQLIAIKKFNFDGHFKLASNSNYSPKFI